MSRTRHLLACLLTLGVLAMLLPGASLAACGGGAGSAGDQQYVDPLAQCNKHHSSTTPAATTTPVTTPAATAATSTTPTAPTATAAADPAKKSKALPYTGFDLRWAAGLGLALMLTGLGLRIRLHNS